MFGTEIKLVTFIIIILEVVVLFSQTVIYLSRPEDKSRFRFLSLTLMFIFYNVVSGFLPDNNLKVNLIIQNIVSIGGGIALAIFYYNYLVQELNMIQDKIFNVKNLIIGLCSTFIIVFLSTCFITNDVIKARQVYILFPIVISLYFCFRTVQFLLKKHKQHSHEDTPYSLMIKTGYIGIVFMATMPIVVFFGDYQVINNSLVNISFLVTYFAYTKYHLYQSKIEFELLSKFKNEIFKEENSLSELIAFDLTKREIEVAHLMLQNLTYLEIANDLFTAENTVSKQGSTIIKKTNCSNKSDFVSKFSSLS